MAIDLAEHLEHFRFRVLQDALAQATASYWLRRAADLEAARHRPETDQAGNATLEELRERWIELTATADACRARATLGLGPDAIADVDVILGEVA